MDQRTCLKPLAGNPRRALGHLAAADPAMSRAIRDSGGFRLPARDPTFHLYASSIIGQSISVKAAEVIVGRVEQHFGGSGGVTPRSVAGADPEELRALGLSTAKARALVDSAGLWVAEGYTPDSFGGVPDGELVRHLSSVRGIGPWTVKMFLIFGLRRPDVLPEEDLGVRVGIQQVDGLSERPAPRVCVERAEVWRPWRTVATVILWRYLMKARNETFDETSGWWKG